MTEDHENTSSMSEAEVQLCIVEIKHMCLQNETCIENSLKQVIERKNETELKCNREQTASWTN